MRVDNSTEVATESDFRSTENGSIIEDDMVGPVRKAYSNGSIDVKVSDGRDNCGTGFPGQDSAPKGDHSLVPCKSDSQDLDKLQAILASKGDEMLRAALRLLLKQRNELYHQQRQLEDEIAQCEKNLQTILSGSEDDLMLKIESVIQACNVACSKDATRTHEEPHFHIEEPLKGVKRKRLSEAILISQNPCQARQSPSLHWSSSVVIKKIWKLRTLGGFESNVTVQGLDFECSGGGDLRGNAREARESAAAHILSKLRCMASLTH
ncbi:hypothetical protein IFM89_026199 [Coptis chinensis]|uniref:DRBM domain-containing protein n=1 Tax=Coptis chinensis TaxID=261450 RepID=A0A835M460_9MAGN|nr:hypothetical protein IFM89_026199 [Coptis chinensis]